MEWTGTVSSVGIAKLAGVGRAAVSNWRRRYTDFPQPVGGTATSPTFDLAAVEKWLAAQGKSSASHGADHAWRKIETVSDGPDLAMSLWLAGAWLFVRWVHDVSVDSDGTVAPGRLVEVLRDVDRQAAELIGDDLPETWSDQQRIVLAAVTGLPVDDPPATFEYLYQRYVAVRGVASGYMTPDVVGRLLLDLAGPAERVLDAACGTGTLVAKAVTANGSIRCFAQDLDGDAARITQVRLLFAHRAAGGGSSLVRIGDSLRADAFPGQRVDAVVSNPPFALHDWGHEQLAYDPRWEFGGLPPRTEPDLAWVQDALAHLAPGGVAVLLMPPAAAARSAGRRIRGELLRRGALRAVIGLPPGLVPSTSIGLHVWVLRRPADEVPPSHVLLVDTSSGGLHADAEAVAVRAWRTFDAAPADLEEAPGVLRAVPVIELLDEDVDVSPGRHLPVDTAADIDAVDLLAARQDLGRTLDALVGHLPAFSAATHPPLASARRVSLDNLARNGALAVHRGPARSAAGPQRPAATGADVVDGAAPTGLAAGDGPVIETGDVLVPMIARSVVARVATPAQVGARVGQNVHLVRADPDGLDPWFLAGVLSAAANVREAVRTSSTLRDMMRVDVKRLQVPVLPLEEQRRYGQAFRRLVEFETALARAAEQGRELARAVSDGLSAGALVPEMSD